MKRGYKKRRPPQKRMTRAQAWEIIQLIAKEYNLPASLIVGQSAGWGANRR